VNLNAIAAAVIGGTSLFGGRGSAYSAVLGIIVIQSIASGLTLLNLSSSLRFMITGAVLAIAVIRRLDRRISRLPWSRYVRIMETRELRCDRVDDHRDRQTLRR